MCTISSLLLATVTEQTGLRPVVNKFLRTEDYVFFDIISGGCATFPSICSDKNEIEKLDTEIKGLRTTYDEKYLENKKAYLDLRTANTDNAYIMYYINETIQAVQTVEEYQDKINQALEIELNKLYKRFEANPNSTVYLDSLVGELEYSLADIRKMIQDTKNNQITGLLVQYLVEFAISKFVKGYTRAYNQVAGLPEDIYSTSVWTTLFSADATEAGIILDPNHPRHAEIMAKNGITADAQVTLKQKFQYTPKVFKQMMANVKDTFKDIGTSLKKWKRIRNWKGFKGKLQHSLTGPKQKVTVVKNVITSTPHRKFFVTNYKLSWAQGGMLAIGTIADAVSVAVDTQQWKTVADEIKKARGKYEEYRDNLREELANITAQSQEISSHWPDIVDTFKNLSLSFKSLIDNATDYSEFNDVLGLPQLPVDVNSPLFSLDFDAVTITTLNSAQAAVIGYMQEVNNDVAEVADQMRARAILYEKVLIMTAEHQPVQDMLDSSHDIYAFSSSQTVQDFGNVLSKQDIVCTIAQLRRTKSMYDFYQLEQFRPRCNVSTTDFASYDIAADALRKEQILTSTVSNYDGDSLSVLVDLVQAAYRSSADENLRQFGTSITDQQVTCTVSRVYPSKQKFDFISLSPFRPDCSVVTTAAFQNMKTDAETTKAAATGVEGALTMCEQYNFCPCPASIAQTNGITESDVIDLIKTLRPTMAQYCGSTGCTCIVLKN